MKDVAASCNDEGDNGIPQWMEVMMQGVVNGWNAHVLSAEDEQVTQDAVYYPRQNERKHHDMPFYPLLGRSEMKDKGIEPKQEQERQEQKDHFAYDIPKSDLSEGEKPALGIEFGDDLRQVRQDGDHTGYGNDDGLVLHVAKVIFSNEFI